MSETKPERLKRPPKPKGLVTSRVWGALVKAGSPNGVRMSGGFGGKAPKPVRGPKRVKGQPHVKPEQPLAVIQYRTGFEGKPMIDRLWAAGLLTPHETAFNTYVRTPKGDAAALAYAEWKNLYDAWKVQAEAEKAKREARKAAKAKKGEEVQAHA